MTKVIKSKVLEELKEILEKIRAVKTRSPTLQVNTNRALAKLDEVYEAFDLTRKDTLEKCKERGCPKCGYHLIPRKGYRHVFCPNCELKERNSAWVKLDIENLKLRKRLERMKKRLKKLKEGFG